MYDTQIPARLMMITKKYPELGQVVHFGYELLMELRQIHPKIDLTCVKLIPELLEVKLKEGSPILEKSTITLPADQLEDVFQNVSLFIAKQRESLRPNIITLLQDVKNKDFDLCSLAKSHLMQEKNRAQVHDAKDYNPSILDILLHITLKPFGHTYGQALSPYLSHQEDLWLKPYCPICGSNPLFAYLEGEEGRRHLFCSWCETSWSFPRIECPYCHNVDQNTLTYFSLVDESENMEKDRISVCQKCKKYIKTLDIRKNNEEEKSDLQIDDLATIHLDLLAEQEGYERIAGHFLFF